MHEKPVCGRCGYVAPMQAKYCPSCGTALVPLSAPLARGIDRILGKLSRFHIGLLGLVLLVSTSVLAAHLIVTGLTFRWSIVLLALVLGCGCAYLGWDRNRSISSDRRLVRMLLFFACMGILLVIVWLIDRMWLSFLSAGGGEVVYAIPGIYVEASVESRRLVVADVPPYWLAVTVYALLAAAAGNLVYKGQARLAK